MKWIRQFGGGSAEGRAKDKALLGGKGANLAEMASLGLPVPPGFTITTEVCRQVMEQGAGQYPDGLDGEVAEALAKVEELTKTTFGDASNPLLVSVRSGDAMTRVRSGVTKPSATWRVASRSSEATTRSTAPGTA